MRPRTTPNGSGTTAYWVHDHVSWPRDKLTHFATGSLEACDDQDPNFFESISTAALLAGRLERIGIAIAGLVVPLRDPRILAKQLATIDRLGGSRLVVAFAIGAIRGDFEVMGVPFERRGKLSNEYLGALRAILDGEQPVSYAGENVAFEGGTFLPKPLDLGLWATGSSEPGLTRAARFADGWMTVYQSVDAYARLRGPARRAPRGAGPDHRHVRDRLRDVRLCRRDARQGDRDRADARSRASSRIWIGRSKSA